MIKEDIHRICKEYDIENYTINEDLSIDVDDHVNLNSIGLLELPLKFRNVSGLFNCSNNQLKSLEGAPSSLGDNFNCSGNYLTSLDGSPSYVGGDFYCYKNNLTSLEGAPNIVKRGFYCSSNNLTSLEGAPSYVGSYFHCHSNPLESLKGIPLNLKENLLSLSDNFTYSDYLKYCKVVERDFKFKKILKCQ